MVLPRLCSLFFYEVDCAGLEDGRFSDGTLAVLDRVLFARAKHGIPLQKLSFKGCPGIEEGAVEALRGPGRSTEMSLVS